MRAFFGHHEGDNQSYRAPDEVDILRRDHDCLKIFRKRVTEAGLLDDASLDAIDKDSADLMDHCVEAASNAPRPTVDQLTTDVYISY